MISKRKIKESMLKEGINTIEDGNAFMDKVLNKLDNEQLLRAYVSAKKKHERKQNDSSKYVMDYIKNKCSERGINV